MFFKKQKLLIFIFLLATLVVASLAWADDETDSALIPCPDGVTKAINWTECSEEDVAKIKAEQRSGDVTDEEIRNVSPSTEIVMTDSGRAVVDADGKFLYLDDMTDEQRVRLGIVDDPDFLKVRGPNEKETRDMAAQCRSAQSFANCMNKLEKERFGQPESNFARNEREQREIRQQSENQAPPPSSPPKEDKNKKQQGLCEALRKAESTTGLTTITGNHYYSKCL